MTRTVYTTKGGLVKIQKLNTDASGKGYKITACHFNDGPFIRDALHVEMDTKNWLYNDDYEAARAAQRDGIKLVYGIPYAADGIYLDTVENRLILRAYSRKMFAAIQKRNS